MPTIRHGLPFRIGDIVRVKESPKHIGEVEAILWSHSVRVRFDDSGWLSELSFDEVERTSREHNEID